MPAAAVATAGGLPPVAAVAVPATAGGLSAPPVRVGYVLPAVADLATSAPMQPPGPQAVASSFPSVLTKTLGAEQPPRPRGLFPLPASQDPLPRLAAELIRIDFLVRRIPSGVVEVSADGRRGYLVVVDGQRQAAWIHNGGQAYGGQQAEAEILDWKEGSVQARVLPADQAQAIGWLWTLPAVCERMPLAWLRPESLLDELSSLPGQVAVWVETAADAGVALLHDGSVVLCYSEREPRLDRQAFKSVMEGEGFLTLRWSEAADMNASTEALARAVAQAWARPAAASAER